MTTATRLLLSLMYPGDLEADVSAARTRGESWRAIAGGVSVKAGVTVSHESMRTWHGMDEADIAKALDVPVRSLSPNDEEAATA